MKRDNWPVGDNGVRPISAAEDICTYCRQPRGAQHLPDCVIRQRTIVARVTVEYVTTAIEDEDASQWKFRMNEGGRCADNTIERLAEWIARWEEPDAEEDHTGYRCLCPVTWHEFVREAEEADESLFGIYVSELES